MYIYGLSIVWLTLGWSDSSLMNKRGINEVVIIPHFFNTCLFLRYKYNTPYSHVELCYLYHRGINENLEQRWMR